MLRKKMLSALVVVSIPAAASALTPKFGADHGMKSGYSSLSSCPNVYGQRAILSQGFLLLPCAM